jgi:hypothetical protein
LRINDLPKGLQKNKRHLFAMVDRQGLPEERTFEQKSESRKGENM